MSWGLGALFVIPPARALPPSPPHAIPLCHCPMFGACVHALCAPTVHRRDLFFNFTGPFEIHDDSEILRRLALQRVWTVALGRGPRYCAQSLMQLRS